MGHRRRSRKNKNKQEKQKKNSSDRATATLYSELVIETADLGIHDDPIAEDYEAAYRDKRAVYTRSPGKYANDTYRECEYHFVKLKADRRKALAFLKRYNSIPGTTEIKLGQALELIWYLQEPKSLEQFGVNFPVDAKFLISFLGGNGIGSWDGWRKRHQEEKGCEILIQVNSDKLGKK